MADKIITNEILEKAVTDVVTDLSKNIYEVENYTDEEINQFFDSAQEIVLDSKIDDTTASTDKVYSSSKVEERLTEVQNLIPTEEATADSSGLMSVTDKVKLDNLNYKLVVAAFLSENEGMYGTDEYEMEFSYKTIKEALETAGITSADEIVGSFLIGINVNNNGSWLSATDVNLGMLYNMVNSFSTSTTTHVLCKGQTVAGGGYYKAKFTVGVIVNA